MPTVTLSVSDMSCGADRISDILEAMDGVESVDVYPDTNRVVVTGDADAAALKARLKSKLNKKLWKAKIKVTIVSEEEDSSEEDEDGVKTVDECYYDDYLNMSSLSLGAAAGAHASSSSSSSRQPAAYHNPPPTTQWSYPPSGDWYEGTNWYGTGTGALPATRIPEPWSPPPVQDPSGWFMGMGVPAARIPEPPSPPAVQDPSAWFFNNQHQFSSYDETGASSSSSQPPRGSYY